MDFSILFLLMPILAIVTNVTGLTAIPWLWIPVPFVAYIVVDNYFNNR